MNKSAENSASKKKQNKIVKNIDKFLKNRKYLKAIQEYEKLSGTEYLDINLISLIGDVYLRLSNLDKAAIALKRVASYYEANEQYAQSLAIYIKIIKTGLMDSRTAIKLFELYPKLGFSSELKLSYKKPNELDQKDLQSPKQGIDETISIPFMEIEIHDEDVDTDVHYSLGRAFYEQGLFEEAIREFKFATADEQRQADCYSMVSLCYRRCKKYSLAMYWINRALALAKEGTSQLFVLKYEQAALIEEMKG